MLAADPMTSARPISITALIGATWLTATACCQAAPPQAPATTSLATLDLSGMTSGWQSAVANAEVGSAGVPLAVGGVAYESGIGTHANSTWRLRLDGRGMEFRAKVGVQDGSPGEVEFIVRGDGRDLFRSGPVRGGDAARPVRIDLTGVRELELAVDALGATTSDHANWLEPVVVHRGAPLPPAVSQPQPEAVLPDLPGEPPNAAAKVEWNPDAGVLRLSYDGKRLFEGKVTGTSPATLATDSKRKRQAFTQDLVLSGTGLRLEGTVAGGPDTLAAETRGEAQQQFPLIRTTIGGPSHSLRNNAIYDRTRDWLFEAPSAGTRIIPTANSATNRVFNLSCSGDEIRLSFRPRYYQWHKNIAHFRPWTYQIRKDSITGWSSWWAFMRNCSQRNCDELLAVWQDKRFADYGYRFIQLDDCFQNEFDRDAARPSYPGAQTSGYVARGPETWLDWRKDLYPAGLNGYAAACKSHGFEPGVWIGTYFTDNALISRHPDWFVRGPDGRPFTAPWSSCGIDATNRAAIDTLVRPTFRGLRKAGFSYVKVDQLRHYLYDNLHRNLAYCQARGVTPAEMFRRYLGAVREELGPDTFLLSCWGVLPESVGIADACRIGGDGYGPMTMQQYNSWNGIVWRNDPDHCDVLPHFKPAEAGNVTKTTAVRASPAETIVRPALASIAGCMLILSDRPQVYQDDANLAGLRRAAPVLFSVPGQLYDFTPERTNNLIRIPRTAITSGGEPTPIDALQFGTVNPWWLNEFNLPTGRWSVLHRINWSDRSAAATEVRLADLGLDSNKEYAAYEFWSKRYLGTCRTTLRVTDLTANGIASIALRETTAHPQLVSTNRHLSQGGVDLVKVEWSASADTLTGTSKVVAGDRYELAVRVPAGFTIHAATFAGQAAEAATDGELLRVSFTPTATTEVPWRIAFTAAR